MEVLMRLMYIEIVIIFFIIASQKKYTAINDHGEDQIHVQNSKFLIALYAFGMIVVSAFRSNFIDTADYRLIYARIGSSLENVFNGSGQDVEKGWLFFNYLLNHISNDSQFMIQVTAVIVISGSVYFLVKESTDVPFSFWIYLCLEFVNTMNGIRQIMTGVIIALLWLRWIREERRPRNDFFFVLGIVLMSTIHKSALICIPVFFSSRGKFFNKWMKSIVFGSLLMFAVPSIYYMVLSRIIGGSDYSQYLTESATMGIMRFLVKIVPVVLVFFYQRNNRIDITEPSFQWIMNISIFNACCSLLSLRMVYFARIGMYFNLFDYILIPWLIEKIFRNQARILIKTIMCMSYAFYYWYQLIAFGGYVRSFSLVL